MVLVSRKLTQTTAIKIRPGSPQRAGERPRLVQHSRHCSVIFFFSWAGDDGLHIQSKWHDTDLMGSITDPASVRNYLHTDRRHGFLRDRHVLEASSNSELLMSNCSVMVISKGLNIVLYG